MLKKISLLCLVIVSHLGFAQKSEELIISGRVSDINGTAISQANVVDIDNNQGTITNINGVFYLNLKQPFTSIRITYVGYIPINRRINLSDIKEIKNDTLFLNFILEPSIEELNEVEINASQIQLAYEKPGVNIIDYQFYENNLLLLLKEDKEFKLRLIDTLDNVIFNSAVRDKPKTLLKDCNEQFYLQYEDSSYQIIINDVGFNIGERYQYAKHNKAASSCVTSINNYLFLREYKGHDKALLYWIYNRETSQKRILQLIVDEESIIAIDDFHKGIERLKAMVSYESTAAGTNDLGILDILRQIDRNELYYQVALKGHFYHPLFNWKDSIFIFNHQVDSAFVFDSNGNYKRKFFIHHHKNKDWAETAYIDLERENVYMKLDKRGRVYLQKIDSRNGNILSTSRIVKHLFPESIKVKGDDVYYLYTDPYQTGTLKKLYKQTLE